MTRGILVVKKQLKARTAAELAAALGVNDGHIYRARKGDVSPTLTAALEAKGYLTPRRPRVQPRRAATFGSQERAKLFDRMLAERGKTLTVWMNQELDSLLTGKEPPAAEED